MKYVVTVLGNLSGQPGGLVNGHAINAAGQVVGSSTNAQGKTHALRTAPNRPIRNTDDLGTIGGDYSAAWAINNLGQVAGDADHAALGTDSPARRGFRLYTDGTMVDPGRLVPAGGTLFASNSSGARGINDAGQVVGLARVPADACGSASHAFRTEPNATIISSPFPPFADGLGTLVSPPYSNCRSSISFAINSAGVAVSESATEVTTGWPNQAFRTAPPVYRIDLNEFGWGNSTAYAVNDLG